MSDAAILNIWNREILLVTGVQKVEMHQHAKFCQNRSIGYEDIKIFQFFKMAAVAILNFRNRKFLFADGIWSAHAHYCSKFRQNRSVRCGDNAFFRIFKMAADAMLDFWSCEILLAIVVERVQSISMPNFVIIGQSVAKVLRFFDFYRETPC